MLKCIICMIINIILNFSDFDKQLDIPLLERDSTSAIHPHISYSHISHSLYKRSGDDTPKGVTRIAKNKEDCDSLSTEFSETEDEGSQWSKTFKCWKQATTFASNKWRWLQYSEYTVFEGKKEMEAYKRICWTPKNCVKKQEPNWWIYAEVFKLLI